MLRQMLRRFAVDDTGATAIEYALLGTLVAVALVASFSLLGNSLTNMFGTTTTGAVGAITTATDTLEAD